MNLLRVGVLIGVAFGILFDRLPASAQEPAAAASTEPATDPFASATESEPTSETDPETDRGLREETIYIPYQKLPTVFEKEGRGVFIPYERFQQLWQAAQQQLKQTEPPETPVQALLSEITSDATITDRVVNVSARLKIEILATGWVTIPLRLRQSAIRTATIDDQPARILFDPRIGHQLLYENPTDQSQVVDLKIEYTRAYSKTPGQSSVSFQAPQAPINQWRIQVPEPGVSVHVEPMIAATQSPAADTDPADGSDRQTQLLAFVGVAPSVRISWNPKAEGASGLAAFATVQTKQQVVVSEGVVRTSTTLDYNISRSTLDTLRIEVPQNEKVISVIDRNIKRWKVHPQDDRQQIQIDLFEPVRGKQQVVVELERFTNAPQDSYVISIPVISALDVGRQQGVVVATLEGELQAEATQRMGLMQLDQNDLPTELQKTDWDFAYRYGAVPYQLDLRIQKIVPRISNVELVDAHLTSDQLTLSWQGLYEIKDAGVFQLRVDVPDDFEIRSVHGKQISDSQPVAVDSYHRISDSSPTILVNLSKRAFGTVGLAIQMRRRLNDPNLLSPTGTTSIIAIPVPRATRADVEFSEGSVVVSAPESLRLNPETTEGLRSISFSEAYRTISAATLPPPLRPVLAFSFASGVTDLAIAAERRRPQVVAEQLLRCQVTSAAVKYDVDFVFDIKYSGVKQLRIDVPTALASEIRNTSQNIRQDQLEPAPNDVAEGYTAWVFAGETELLGRITIQLKWEEKIDELQVGKSHEIEVPRLIPSGVDRATGQVVLSKSESIDIQPTGKPSGLRPIDPQEELLPEANVTGAAMAFEFVGPWNLSIQAKRYELETSKRTSIDRGLVRVVILGHDRLSVQAVYRMRSARQRVSIKLPEGAEFDARPLRINGQPVTPERDSATEIFAPLVDQSIDESFLLEIRFSMPGRPSQLKLPSFPDEPAIQKVFVGVYLPERYSLLASRGPWANEQGNHLLLALTRSAAPPDDQLIEWVSEDVSGASNSIRTFATGKSNRFVFSALQPAETPDGSLRLTVVNRNLFQGTMILMVVLIGLPFVGRRWQLQIALLLLVTVILLFLGVLSPELAQSVFGGVFPIAVVIMLLLWLIGHLLKLRKFIPRRGQGSNASADADPNSSTATNLETDQPNSQPPESPFAAAEKPSSDTQAEQEDRHND